MFCDRPPSSLPAHTYVANFTNVRPGDKVDLLCDLSYAVNGNKDHTVQTITCVGFGNWNLGGAFPCGGEDLQIGIMFIDTTNECCSRDF